MIGKTLGYRSTAAAVAAALWGMAPFAAQAIGPPQAELVTVTSSQDRGCGPVAGAFGAAGGGKPFTVAVEPRVDAVKAAPFSGVGTSEIVTTLADGNRIVRTNTMKYYRDGRGRTRTEYSLAAIGPFTPDQAQTLVTISDPIEGKRYVLHSVDKHADILPLLGKAFFESRSGTKEADEGNVDGASAKESSSGGPTGSRVVTRAAPKGNGIYLQRGFVGTTEHIDAPMPPPPPGVAPGGPPVMVMSTTIAALPAANAGFIMQYAPAPPGISAAACNPNAKPLPAPASLGERIIEGLKVTGTRQEFTIPSGAVGNEQPIVVSSEQWFSPDLGVVVASSVRDPMMGDTTYKLEQVSRNEPDPALFSVPSDYKTTDLTANGGVFFKSAPDVDGPGPAPKAGVMSLRAAPALPAKSNEK